MIETIVRRSWVVALLCGAVVAFGACGGDDDGGGGNTDLGNDLPACDINRSGLTYPAELSDGESTMRPTKVIFEAVDFANETVVIRNVGTETISFSDSWRVYTQGSEVELLGATLAPGARLKVHLTDSGLNDADDFYCGRVTAWIEACGGELAILNNPDVNQGWFNDPAFVEAFVIWGNRMPLADSATLNNEAVGAGTWSTAYNGDSSNVDVCWSSGRQPTCTDGPCNEADLGIVAIGDVTDPAGWVAVDSSQANCLVY